MALQALAQNRLTGKVVASDNEAIIYRIGVAYGDSTRSVTGSFYGQDFSMAIDSLCKAWITIASDGYESIRLEKTLQAGNNDLGEIILYKKAVELGEVVVKARKNEIERNGPNYTIRNLQGTPIGDAGNLKDMLRWTPGMMVDGLGNISVIGSGSPLVYIDGRKVTNEAELEALSSADVSSIEIIKEPDARYKNGTNAVVIIHMKKQLKDYLGATLSSSFTQRRRFGYNPRINLSGKIGAVSGTFSFNYNRVDQHSYDAYETTIYHNDGRIFRNSSEGGYVAKPQVYTVFGGLNFALSDNSVLGVQYTGRFLDMKQQSGHDLLLDNNGELTPKTEQSRQEEKLKSHSTSVSYRWNRNEHSALTLIADYAAQRNETAKDITETNLQTDIAYPTLTAGNTDYDIYTFNGDYTFSFNGKDKEQIGLETGYTRNHSDNAIDQAMQSIRRKNQWTAAYLTFQRTWGKLALLLGLRYEYDYTDTRMLEGGEENRIRKTYSDFFPNVRLTYKADDKKEFSLSYRRSIGRPSFNDLSPIVSYEDSLNYWVGNPWLKPSFTNTLSLTANLGVLTLRANYYYKTNPIVSIYGQDETNSNILVMSPLNIDHSQEWDVGVEYSQSFDNRISLSAFGYLTGSYITYPYLGKETFYRNIYTYLGLYFSYNFYKNFTVYASNYYTSPYRNGTQKIGYSLNTNAGISGKFLNNKLYVSLEGQDLFAKGVTPWWENNYGNTSYWRRNRYDTRCVSLTLRYTFNSVKTNFRSRSGNSKLLQRTN